MDQRAAEAAALDDRKLCATALDGKRTDFEVDPNFRVYVEEAKKRSLNVQKCITLVASPPVDTTGLLEKAKLLVGDLEAYAKSSPSTPLSPVVVRAAVAVNAIIQTSDRADLQSALGELEAALGGNADALAYLAETQRKRDETKKADASRTNDEARLLASFLEGFAAANLTDARTVRVLTAADALARAKDKADDGAVSSATTLLSELNLQEAYTEFKAQRCSAEKTPAC